MPMSYEGRPTGASNTAQGGQATGARATGGGHSSASYGVNRSQAYGSKANLKGKDAHGFLNRPNLGLHIVSGLWRELVDFSSGSICMVLASHKYDENDYVRDFNNFLDLKT